MRKLAIVIAFAACPLPILGQFQSLATNADGSVLYMTSSLVLDGMAANVRPELRIYSVVPDVAVAVERSVERRPTNSFGSGDGADSAQVSNDNLTLGYTLQGICDPSPLPCIQPKTVSEVRVGANITVLGEGMLHLSRNGRWALLTPNNPFSPSASATLIDLTTGTRSDVPVPVFGAILPISSDGTILVSPKSPAEPAALWRNGDIIQLYMTGLGAVQGDVQTGKPAPLDSLRPLRDLFQCRFTPQTTLADTLFAGLAPDLVGVYQVTFRMPPEPVPPQLTGMNCGNFIFGGLGWPATP